MIVDREIYDEVVWKNGEESLGQDVSTIAAAVIPFLSRPPFPHFLLHFPPKTFPKLLHSIQLVELCFLENGGSL